MVDETRVLRLLRSVTDDISFLETEARADAQRRSDPVWLRGVKYAFVTAVEACIDVAQHICSSQGWGPPADNGDAMRLLGEHRVIPAELSRRMRLAVGFHNVLVHEYGDVDDAVVLRRLSDLADLQEFVRAVTRWLP